VDPEAAVEPPAEQCAVVDRYVDAFERADVPAITALLADDIVLEMPPNVNWFAGREDYAGFMRRIYRLRGTGWRTEPIWANGEAGFVAYVDGLLHTVQVLTVADGRVMRTTVFQAPEVFEAFGVGGAA
jgi:RNA polymerase sigma-70 factor (ECF subfamily)